MILVAAGLIGALLLLTGRTGATDTYFAVYDNVSGIRSGTPVRFEGYRIGQVNGVKPVTGDGPVRFRVALAVDRGFPIPSDSEAAVASAGLLSGSTIAISRGQSPDKLDPGAELDTAPARSVMAAMSSMASTVGQITERGLEPLLAKLNRSADALNRLMTGAAPRIARNLEDTSQSLSGMSERIDDKLLREETIAKLRRTLDSAAAASKTLNEEILGARNTSNISDTLANLKAVSEQTLALTRQLQETRNRLDSVMARVDSITAETRPAVESSIDDLRYSLSTISRRIDAITYNLESTTRNMHEFARQIRRNPGLLLRGGTPAEATE